uniref:Sodefrin-like factor n=1 Tax=Cynops pyrrhogaster TaxID=8330 RepID=A0A140IHE9_CYNPY|nr:sodefrin precursor-like factor [Cynops pyrrhogaster]
MRVILAAVIMLQSLITGDCLICEQCFAVNASSCSGIFKQCSPDVTHCVAGLENNTLGSNVILTAFKDCLNPSQIALCSGEFSTRNSAFVFEISRTCCESDFCNQGDVQVPAVDETPNGYKCGGCIDTRSTGDCTVTGDVQCTGQQNACGSFYGTVARPGKPERQTSIKGCATQDFCKRGISSMVGTQANSYSFLCFPAEKQ